MTTNDLTNAAPEIEAKYYELGGKKEFLSSFLLTLGQSIEFGLNASWVETALDLVDQWFNDKHRGIVAKKKLADIISEIAEKSGNGEKNYSFLDKKYM